MLAVDGCLSGLNHPPAIAQGSTTHQSPAIGESCCKRVSELTWLELHLPDVESYIQLVHAGIPVLLGIQATCGSRLSWHICYCTVAVLVGFAADEAQQLPVAYVQCGVSCAQPC